MMIIKNECAGSGKTYGIAKKICADINLCPPDKNIFAITHTNSAKKEIIDEIVNQLNYIPVNVIVETIDTFLLKRLIYPFSKLLLGYDYNTCSISKLPSKDTYRAKMIKELKDDGIIHSEKILSESLKIFSWNSKKQHEYKKKMFSFFSSDIYKLYIDETQDMAKEGINLIKCFALYNLNIYCVGDFRQDLKGYNCFKELIISAKNHSLEYNGQFMDLSYYSYEENNVTRRTPIKILKMANNLYSKEFECSTKLEGGTLTYSYFDDKKISQELLDKYDLVYIDKKTGVFFTEKNTENKLAIDFSKIEKEILCECFSEVSSFNIEILINHFIIYYMLEKDSYKAYLKLISHYGIQFNKIICAKFCAFKPEQNSDAFYVQSIDKVKGREGNNCLFVVTHNMLEKMLHYSEDNKEKNKLYVALSRSKNHLHFLIYDIVANQFDKNEIEKYMHDNDVSYCEL